MKCDRVLRNVGTADGEYIALLQAALGKRRGHQPRAVRHLSERQRLPTEPVNERGLVLPLRHVLEDELGEWDFGNGDLQILTVENHGVTPADWLEDKFCENVPSGSRMLSRL